VPQAKTFTVKRQIIVVILCFYAAPIVFGQAPPNRTQTRTPVNETLGVNRPQIGILVPRTSTVPSLFGMNRVEVARVLEPLHLQAKFSGPDNGIAIGQEPGAGKTVRYGSGVAVTLEMPRLVLSGPAAPAYAGSELTFTAAFVPPLPAGLKVGYYFVWGDGSRGEPTASAVVTHRFADAGNRVVSVVAFIERFQIASRVPVDVLAPPPPVDTTPTATDATTTTSATTATVATEGSTATEPTTTTESTTSSSTTTTTAPTNATEQTTDTTPTTTTTTGTTGGGTSSNLLVWIGAAAVVLLLVVTFLLAKVLRALNRKPSEPQVQAKSPVAFNGGMKSAEYEIEHPELIRRMPEVALRGGIRGEGDGDV
jgi:hypothetical protein